MRLALTVYFNSEAKRCRFARKEKLSKSRADILQTYPIDNQWIVNNIGRQRQWAVSTYRYRRL